VKARVGALGVGDACLELHSQKTRKKAALEELRRTLLLGRPRLGAVDDDLLMLAAARQGLKAQCQAVNTPVAASGVTPYQAYGALMKLQADEVGALPVTLEIAS